MCNQNNHRRGQGQKVVNPYTHCAICDTQLSEYQGIDRFTGKPSDLCSSCRDAVSYSIINHREDQEEMKVMERFGWRSHVKESSIDSDFDLGYGIDNEFGE